MTRRFQRMLVAGAARLAVAGIGLGFAHPLCAGDPPAPPGTEEISLGRTTLPLETVMGAYRKLWNRYVILPSRGELVRAREARAICLDGVVVGLASGRRAIVEAGSRRYAVVMRFGTNPTVGEKIRLMAVPSNVPQFSHERETDTRASLPQYHDVTMSFDEFVQSIRRGHHFPEAPELGTRPNRIGLFQTGRGDRNKVEGLVREREQQQLHQSKPPDR